MRLATALLAMGMAVGTVWGQSPSIIDQTRQKLAGVQQQQAAASNEALAATQGQGNAPPTSANRSTSTATVSKPTTAKPAAKPAAGNATPPPQAANTKKPQVTVIPMVAPKEAGRPRTATTNADKAPSAPLAKPVEAKPEPAPEIKTTAAEKREEPKAISMAGRRDPFVSPVVSHISGGSGCSTGKRCLAVDQIALTGVVKSDGGMIAVVVNAMNKAYFLRENDPVFNGYVVKITGDSIVFRETTEDSLGKPVSREVTKKIIVPAV